MVNLYPFHLKTIFLNQHFYLKLQMSESNCTCNELQSDLIFTLEYKLKKIISF